MVACISRYKVLKASICAFALLSCVTDGNDIPLPKYKLTVIEPPNGTVDVESGEYVEGTRLFLTATPNRYHLASTNIRWEFNEWKIYDEENPRWDINSNPIMVIIDKDIKIEPTFTLK